MRVLFRWTAAVGIVLSVHAGVGCASGGEVEPVNEGANSEETDRTYSRLLDQVPADVAAVAAGRPEGGETESVGEGLHETVLRSALDVAAPSSPGGSSMLAAWLEAPGPRREGVGVSAPIPTGWVFHSVGAAVVAHVSIADRSAFKERLEHAVRESRAEPDPSADLSAPWRVYGSGAWRASVRVHPSRAVVAVVPAGHAGSLARLLDRAGGRRARPELVERLNRAAARQSGADAGVIAVDVTTWAARAAGLRRSPGGSPTLPGLALARETPRDCREEWEALVRSLPDVSARVQRRETGWAVEVATDDGHEWLRALRAVAGRGEGPPVSSLQGGLAALAIGVDLGHAVDRIDSGVRSYRRSPLSCPDFEVLDRAVRRLGRWASSLPDVAQRVQGLTAAIDGAERAPGAPRLERLSARIHAGTETPGTLVRALEVHLPGFGRQSALEAGRPVEVPGLASRFAALPSAAVGMTDGGVVLTVGSDARKRTSSWLDRTRDGEASPFLAAVWSPGRLARLLEPENPPPAASSWTAIVISVEADRLALTVERTEAWPF